MITLAEAFDLVERGDPERLSRDRIEVPETFNWAHEVFEGRHLRRFPERDALLWADDAGRKVRYSYREFVAAGCKNAKQAAIRAGYAGDASAEVTASRLLRNPTVAAEIERAQGRLLRRDETSRDRWLRELETLAFFDPIECFDAKGRLLSLHRMPERARHTVASLVGKGAEFKLVFHDRDKALTRLAKYLGLFDKPPGADPRASRTYGDLSPT
jgi:hypothetical protein